MLYVLCYLLLGYLSLAVITLVFKRDPENAVAILGIILLWPLVLALVIVTDLCRGVRDLFAW